MDPGELFGAIVVIAVGGVILLTLSGANADPLIEVLPEIVVVGFFIAVVVGLIQSI